MFLSNICSRIFGSFAKTCFPTPIQEFINSVYVRIFRINLDEFETTRFKNLNALFTRRLKTKRTFDMSPTQLISPTDSLITESALTTEGKALQIKSMQYSISELLGENLDCDFFYLNFYLSPRDYHRYHAPCDLEIEEIRYFGGCLRPVNMPSLMRVQNLFVKNERIVVKAKMPNGKKIYFVAIGALNVGSIIFHCEPKIKTNAKRANQTYTYATPIKVAKGDELGMFEMGSTIVLFIQDFTPNVATQQIVKFAQNIGYIN
ncbi:MAG: phosphatidylserine decarboxylase [Helicobacter sp.]|uniref:phosphatidylserine decarboxylase n=1 Tax=Helicobacter sp. 10-6591 TaxID=2004998 RepID=UPI000DCC986C|nr:phosphatidylserine decarboxylase [Helicobacter sp. 10-6591]MCI6218118.1 phosphatidylserine decarboxylase [Helicobacter sp.]RAX55386.1 phosphatidylserine decarboxylase [Helicobacter sp. 10-6591]